MRAWAIRLRLLVMSFLLGTAVILISISPILAQETKEKETKKPWTGKLRDGREITKDDLTNILQAHKLWQDSIGKEGQKADLSGADLSGADLSRAYLLGAQMIQVNLTGSNLSRACLFGAILIRAKMNGADLRRTDLKLANLSGAKLGGANLSGADLIGADLLGVDLFWAVLSGAIFEPLPGKLTDISLLLGIKGLPSLTYKNSSHGLVELREVYKKAGMQDQQRELTFALNHTRREKLWKEEGFLNKLESLFHLVFFELTCDYGMTPGRPLRIMGLGIILFVLPYFLALRSKNPETGIWRLLSADRVLDRKIADAPVKLRAKGWWDIRAWGLAFYFSLLSAFHIGWRDLNVGSWIARLQFREYNLRATGWARFVSGLQSLLSVYMIALWVLTYFGRPFG